MKKDYLNTVLENLRKIDIKEEVEKMKKESQKAHGKVHEKITSSYNVVDDIFDNVFGAFDNVFGSVFDETLNKAHDISPFAIIQKSMYNEYKYSDKNICILEIPAMGYTNDDVDLSLDEKSLVVKFKNSKLHKSTASTSKVRILENDTFVYTMESIPNGIEYHVQNGILTVIIKYTESKTTITKLEF